MVSQVEISFYIICSLNLKNQVMRNDDKYFGWHINIKVGKSINYWGWWKETIAIILLSIESIPHFCGAKNMS